MGYTQAEWLFWYQRTVFHCLPRVVCTKETIEASIAPGVVVSLVDALSGHVIRSLSF